jgi:class 3 adenylate cyclase/tetratricopeptide (TPR) repeat protein
MPSCPRCGQENPEVARFCLACGAPLAEQEPAREERKIVSVLFCDLVGFTAQAERLDPEEVRGLLQPYHARVRSELERHGGTVEKFIGDAVMAVFGAPLAHEDDPERAVRAALAIREGIAEEGRLEVRVGVTTGEALIALGARLAEGEGMASGDVVNTAARLQAAAPVNGVLVDEATFRATERAIQYEEASAVHAKGKAEPVRVWEARRARARVGIERLHGAALVGRERELALLRETLARVEGGREPQLVTLVGVPGIGKSRLVFELFQDLEQRPEFLYWRHGRSLPYGEGVTFWALAELIKAHAGILESDTAEVVDHKLHEAVDAAVVDGPERDWIERHLRPLAGLETVRSQEDKRSEAFAAWRRFLEALADERTLVLVFEDLHWAEDALLDFVDELADRTRGVPMLVLATARPELLDRRPGWGGGKLNSSTILLSPLSDEETARLVHALLGRSVLAADVQAALLDRAEGNPLYAEEFARVHAQNPGDETLPKSVQGLIAARLDALPREEKELLQTAAVMGRLFWLGWLGGERWLLEDRLHALERKEFVRRERRTSVASEVEYVFRHGLVRDVAYEQIPKAERAAKHLGAADWIESLGRPKDHAELLAHHILAALDYGAADTVVSARARQALQHAGDRAFSLNAFARAGSYYARALALSKDEEPELLFRWAESLHRAGSDSRFDALADARDRLVAASRKDLAALAAMLLSRAWWYRGVGDRSLESAAEAEALVQDEPPSLTKARVLDQAARIRMVRTEPEAALALAREALAMAGSADVVLRAGLLGTIGFARVELGDSRGLEDLEQSLALARQADPEEAGRAAQNTGVTYYEEGDTARSESLAREAFELAKQSGSPDNVRFQEHVFSWFDIDRGRWDDALQTLNAIIASSELDPAYTEIESRWHRATIELARGDTARALEDVERSLELAAAVMDPQMVLPALSFVVQAYAELDRPEDARRLADQFLETAAAYQGPTYCFVQLAWVAHDIDRGRALAELLAGHNRRSSPWIAATRAVLERDYERAAKLFAEIGALQHEARAHLKAAETLAAAGRRAEADDHLQQALAFYRSVGARRYVGEAEALLAASA